MSKPYLWTGKTALGSIITNEAYSEADAKVRAESMGCTEFHCEENPEYTDSDAIADVTPEIASQSASEEALKNKTDMQVLAEANTTLFNQVDGLKNQAAILEMDLAKSNDAFAILRAAHEKALDAKALILAWNTEQQAHASAENKEYQEPAWLDSVRQLA